MEFSVEVEDAAEDASFYRQRMLQAQILDSKLDLFSDYDSESGAPGSLSDFSSVGDNFDKSLGEVRLV